MSEEPEIENGNSREDEHLWDTGLRRTIRKGQREIISAVHKNRDDVSLPDDLIKRVSKLDSFYSKVVTSKEAAIDSEGFRLLSAIGREQVEATHGSLIQFETSTYAEKLVTYMGGRRTLEQGTAHLNWTKLGDRAAIVFRKPPPLNFLFGAFELEPVKKRSANSKQRRNKDSEKEAASQPKDVKDLDDEVESTTKDVQNIFKHLRRICAAKGRVNFFNFLVDPDSYGQTVENIFHFDFLVKDGRAGIILGKDNLPYIYIPDDTTADGQSTKTVKQQGIVSLTINDWKKAIVKFNISSACIPARTD